MALPLMYPVLFFTPDLLYSRVTPTTRMELGMLGEDLILQGRPASQCPDRLRDSRNTMASSFWRVSQSGPGEVIMRVAHQSGITHETLNQIQTNHLDAKLQSQMANATQAASLLMECTGPEDQPWWCRWDAARHMVMPFHDIDAGGPFAYAQELHTSRFPRLRQLAADAGMDDAFQPFFAIQPWHLSKHCRLQLIQDLPAIMDTYARANLWHDRFEIVEPLVIL